MKINLGLFSIPTVLVAAATGAEQSRELQNGYNYDNVDEYVKAKMAGRSFSITGCSSTPAQSNSPSRSYVTFRMCDSCSSSSSWSGGGCDDTNGDFVINMQTFAESFGEYLQETYGAENSPFQCVRYVQCTWS